jgi:signal transduction histidine kinase/CheY-like chemotaxis protein
MLLLQVKNYLFILIFLLSNFGFSQTLDIQKKTIEKQIGDASINFQSGNYENALKLSQLALIESLKLDDDFLIAHSYNSIGVIYNEFSNAKRAKEFYNKALFHAEKTNDDKLKNWVYGNLGSFYYFDENNPQKGLEFYKKSLFLAEKTKDTVQINFTKLNIASAYFTLNDYQSGIVYVNQIQDYVLNNNDEESKLILIELLGLYNSNKLNNSIQAENYFLKAIEIGKKNELNSYLVSIYSNLSKHYKKNGNIDKYIQFEKESKQLSENIFSDEKSKNFDNQAVQIELDVNEIQLDKIELAYEKQAQKIYYSRIIIVLFLIIVSVLLSLLYYSLRNNKLKKENNLLLIAKNKELELANKKALESSKLKSQFVSTISHELRTPLYGVIGITNLLKDEHKELKSSSHLKSLEFSANYLLSLVNDILHINKIDENKTKLVKNPFSLFDEIHLIKNSLTYLIESNNNVFNLNFDSKIPKSLIGDKLRLSQILMNLLSNALKFTKNGTINLNILITFEIIDTGIGIDEEDQIKIFQKFVQVGKNNEDYQGTGLGLSIVKRLIKLFDSEIHLKSKLNEGTKFEFTIAFEENIENIESFNQNNDLYKNLNLKVLVVEDNKINQIVTQKIIEKSNSTCTIAENGFEAIEILSKNKFDIILMDINMPLINGFETSKKIREMAIETPIIALTAYSRNEILDKSKSCGINDILIKPFEPNKLFEIIANQINIKS